MKRLILVKRYESTFYKNQPYMKKWTQRETISLISRLFLPIFDRSPSPRGGLGWGHYSPLFMSPNPYSATMM